MLVVSIAFVVSGLWLLNRGASSAIVAYAAIVSFGACGVFAALQLVPGSSFLKATHEGLEVRTLWRTQSIRWADVQQFGVLELPVAFVLLGGREKFVGFNYLPTRRPLSRGRSRPVDHFGVGFEAMLPDTYGHDPEDLVARLEELRQRFTKAV